MIWLVVAVLLVFILYSLMFSGPPYVPTISQDIDKAFAELGVGRHDHVVDLGSGDGRALLKASERGARASGAELNLLLVLISRFRLRKQKQARVNWGSMWRYEIPDDATHIFIFGAGHFMKRFDKKITDFTKKKHPLLVMSYGFGFEGRTVDKIIGPFNIYQF